MPDVVYCPRCETPCLEDEDQRHVLCPKCFFRFCSFCGNHRHIGVTCMTPEEKLRILQERQSAPEHKEEKRRKESKIITEILSMKEISRYTKQCPSCGMAIHRAEGRNHMKCKNCEQSFCYRCGKAPAGHHHCMS